MGNNDVASHFSFSFNIRHMQAIFVCIGLADASIWKKRAMGSLLDSDATQCAAPKQTLCLFFFTMTLNELEINPLKWLELQSSRNQARVRLPHSLFTQAGKPRSPCSAGLLFPCPIRDFGQYYATKHDQSVFFKGDFISSPVFEHSEFQRKEMAGFVTLLEWILLKAMYSKTT